MPGLVGEAATLEGLLDDLRALVPDPLEWNAVSHAARIDLTMTAERRETIESAARG